MLTHDTSFADEGAEVAHSVSQVLQMVKGEEECFIMGGAAVYRQFLPFAQRIYMTWVWQDFDADVFFPVIDKSVFHEISATDRYFDEASGLSFSYAEYVRNPLAEKMM